MKGEVVILALVCVSLSGAQVKIQAFVSTGVTTAWTTGVRSVVTTGGAAALVPVSKKWFVRPVVAAGRVISLSPAKSFPLVQAGGLVGYRATKRVSVLGGYLETMQFPKPGALYLPTAVVSTAIHISRHLGVFVPATFNEKALGLSGQFGVTF